MLKYRACNGSFQYLFLLGVTNKPSLARLPGSDAIWVLSEVRPQRMCRFPPVFDVSRTATVDWSKSYRVGKYLLFF